MRAHIPINHKSDINLIRFGLGPYFLAGVMALLAGCVASLHVREGVDIPQSGGPMGRGVSGDIQITSQAITDGTIIKEIFGKNLLESGAVPIFVTIENSGTHDSYIFRPEGSTLLADDSEFKLPESHRIYSGREGEALGWIGVVLVPFGVIPGLVMVDNGPRISANRIEVNYQIAKKIIGVNTISPGQSVDGYLIFNVAGMAGRDVQELRIRVTNSRTGKADVVRMSMLLP